MFGQLRRERRPTRTRRGAPRRPRAFVPGLGGLEDRRLLTTIIVSAEGGQAIHAGAGGTLGITAVQDIHSIGEIITTYQVEVRYAITGTAIPGADFSLYEVPVEGTATITVNVQGAFVVPYNTFPRTTGSGNGPDPYFTLQVLSCRPAGGGTGFDCAIGTPSATVTIVGGGGVDLDIDSDNNNGTGPPDRSDVEEQAEDTGPGKIMAVDGGDADKDGVPGFAEGFNLMPGAASDVDPSAKFVPIVLEVSGNVDFSTAHVTFAYDASDPSGVVATPTNTPGVFSYQPAPGGLRSWTKNGNVRRNKASRDKGGDYLAPGVAYTAAQLGLSDATRTVTFYVEDIAPSQAVGDLRVVATLDWYGAAGADESTDGINATGLQADLGVDTNRDGKIDDADQAGEGDWTDDRGAIFNVNFDRDGNRVDSHGRPLPDAIAFDDKGRPVNEDKKIDNAADVPDITPLLVRQIGALPAGVTVFLKAAEEEDIESIHVYKKIAPGETAIWGGIGDRTGGKAEPLEEDITKFVNTTEDSTFGIEGLFFRNLGTNPANKFDGVIDLTLEVRLNGTVLSSNSVRMKVAPWMMISNQEPSTEVWAVDDGEANADLRHGVAGTGYYGLDDSGQLKTATVDEVATDVPQWFQDHVEIGYTQRPGGPKQYEVFRLPYSKDNGPMPDWPVTKLLGPGVGVFELGNDLGPDSGDPNSHSGSFGGNLEILPPSDKYKLGRIIVGNNRSDGLWTFLTSQEVQKPTEVWTKWLSVGHVDEVVGFTGNAKDQVAVADPASAFGLLKRIPAADRGKTVFFSPSGTSTTLRVSNNLAIGTRIFTGVDLRNKPWHYLRIYDDSRSGSGAAGQVAHIKRLGNGYIDVDKVWDTGSRATTELLSQGVDSRRTWATTPEGGDRIVLVKDTQFWQSEEPDPNTGHVTKTPAIITVQEVLIDKDLINFNMNIAQRAIKVLKDQLNHAGGGNLQFVKVPVIFVGDPSDSSGDGRTAFAFTPDLANLQSVGGKLYFPRQFGPRVVPPEERTAQDLFETATSELFPGARFVDDWDLYHANEGEVHCATATKRKLPTLDWWANLK
jgi:hypothetical protein